MHVAAACVPAAGVELAVAQLLQGSKEACSAALKHTLA